MIRVSMTCCAAWALRRSPPVVCPQSAITPSHTVATPEQLGRIEVVLGRTLVTQQSHRRAPVEATCRPGLIGGAQS